MSEAKVTTSDEQSTPDSVGNGGVTEIPSDAEGGSGHGQTNPIESTKRGLKPRHAQMIALGGTIGMLVNSHWP